MAAKSSAAADRQYLARVSSQTGMQINAGSDAYAHRLANRFRAQEAKGVPLSRQAARGHRVTPEHGLRGARPRLPAPVVRYGPPPKSKYTNRTQPLRHHRPKGIKRRMSFDRGVVYTVRTEAEVWTILDAWNPDDRVVLTGFDCTTGKWVSIFANETGGSGKHSWHKPQAGARLDYIRELVMQANTSLESFMVEWSQDEYRGQPLTHVCLFQIHVYPRERQPSPQIARNPKALRH